MLTKVHKRYVDLFRSEGCNLLTTLDEFTERRKDTNKVERISIKYIAKCGHVHNITLRSFFQNNGGRYCVKCNGLQNLYTQYEKYCEIFKEHDCKILFTFSEFVTSFESTNCVYHINVLYLASCRHEEYIRLDSFILRKCGYMCKSCTNLSKIENSTSTDGQSKFNQMEDDGISYLLKILDKFEIKFPEEGCITDLAIKPIEIKDDSYIKIQIKTTQNIKSLENYQFHIGNRLYKDHVIVCICVTEGKIWLFDGNLVKVVTLHIGKNSIYNINEIKVHELHDKISVFYQNLPKYTFSEINSQLSENCKKELEFKTHREKMCNFINFEYEQRRGLVYDFKINDKKIQEKVGNQVANSVLFSTVKSNHKKCYEHGDNDFYWLHCPDKEHFLIIPEEHIINKKHLTINLNNAGELHKYMYSYSNIDRDKILNIFN